jgi:hypothetical protein
LAENLPVSAPLGCFKDLCDLRTRIEALRCKPAAGRAGFACSAGRYPAGPRCRPQKKTGAAAGGVFYPRGTGAGF